MEVPLVYRDKIGDNMRYFLALIFLFTFNSFAGDCGLKDSVCAVKYVRTVDGDTFYADVPKFHHLFKDKLGIRFKYINTPELRAKSSYEKAKALEAKEFVKVRLEKAKKINLFECERGKYFRIVCRVVYDDKDLGCELLKNGLAIRYESTKNVKYCE